MDILLLDIPLANIHTYHNRNGGPRCSPACIVVSFVAGKRHSTARIAANQSVLAVRFGIEAKHIAALFTETRMGESVTCCAVSTDLSNTYQAPGEETYAQGISNREENMAFSIPNGKR
jgi:hypothetical protein